MQKLAIAGVLLSASLMLGADITVTGELLDVGCHTKSVKAGSAAGATSANHADCALLCAKKGMPVGVLSGNEVYWVVGKLTRDDNKALLQFVNKQVRVTGPVRTVDGRKTIDARQIEVSGK